VSSLYYSATLRLLTPSVPPQLSYHPRWPHPRDNRSHASCPTTIEQLYVGVDTPLNHRHYSSLSL